MNTGGNDYHSSNTLNMEQMKINATYIWNALGSQGWTLNAVARNVRKYAIRKCYKSSEGGKVILYLLLIQRIQVIGLVQWTPYTKYTSWISPADPSTMDNNLSRILYEIQNNLQWIATSQYNYSFSDFTQSTDTPYNLALAFLANYERPADPNQPKRRNTG